MENRRLTISGVLKDGFKKTFSYFLACLKGILFLSLMGFLVLVGLVLINWSWVATILRQAPELIEQMRACADNAQCIKTIFWPLISPHILLFIASAVAAILVYMWLAFSMQRYFLNVHDTGTASIRDFLLPLGKAFNMLIAASLVLLIVLGGLVLLIIPGIYWGIRFSQFQYFIIDKDAGIIESLKMSWAATDGYSLKLLVLYLIIGFIASLATSIFFVLAVFTLPFQYITYACMYRSLTSAHGAAKSQENQA
jgi:hypothetical protein